MPITPDFIMKLGWAAGKVLAKNGDGPVLIGKDTRISGYMFESALEAGLSAAGVDICLLGPMPTPGIAYLTRNARAQAGIVISASHNSFHDNGIKFFSSDGTKLPDHIELEIEKELEKPIKVTDPEHLGKARRIEDAARRYIEFCKFRVNNNLDLKGIRIVIDCAHGATYHIAPHVFDELGADVITIGNKPDGFNINVEHGATKPELLQEKVLEQEADIGIALDGDGDRLIMVDHRGEVVDGDEILFVISQSRLKTVGGGIVGTVLSGARAAAMPPLFCAGVTDSLSDYSLSCPLAPQIHTRGRFRFRCGEDRTCTSYNAMDSSPVPRRPPVLLVCRRRCRLA